MVEGIRLIMVALFASAGWEVASAMGRDNTLRATLGIAIGAGIGFVFSGMLGRVTASAASDVERAFRNIPAAELVAGAIGLILGLVPAALLSVPLFHLPPQAALPNVAFVYVLGGLIGSRIARARSDELFALVGVKPRVAERGSGERVVLDTSALIDARLEPLVRMGFGTGSLSV